ncbi:Helicase conserved C-terminal domain-containing protein [Variovorax sp. CF079]|uniref:DEAD/DEAH box helicase n=1 Tax=Variovorax sp. CF079 TaxID=1882774 RepID=UPI00088B1F2A|nr:DEAD/DEAH box helicase [Variovorax sp. CF079]SDC45045.1 Helicase conserved C-terminal domain-containing protein [Variovorax sp. CF079]
MRRDLTPDAVRWDLTQRVEAWLKDLPIQAAAAINEFLSQSPESPELLAGRSLVVPASTVATWSATAADQLGLPANCPLALDVRLSGAMGKPGAQINVRWLQPGKSITAKDAERRGIWMDWQGKVYRLCSPVYEVLALVERFNASTDASIEEQFRHWAQIREALGEAGTSQITDGFLKSFRVVSASALTFSISTDARGDVQIDPVLLTNQRDESGEGVHQVRALSEVDERLFPQRLDQLREGVPAFPLSQGTYVVADERLQKALIAVRGLRKAPAEQRKRAAMHPEAVLRELTNACESEPSVFVETERFAERVMDIGEWAAPIVPWIKIAGQDWGAPTAAGIRIDGAELPLDKPTIDKAIDDLEAALAKGEPEVQVAGRTIAASKANVGAMKQLKKALDLREKGRAASDEESKAVKNVLLIETNLDEASFTRVKSGARSGTLGLPMGLRTTPKPHQELGIAWLQRHWLEGSRGALLCDDMGLGKTFQALAFCVWLRELMDAGALERRPLLLVAPVGLLRNWEAEIEEHLHSPGLGDIVRAYGDHLRALKRGRHVDGTAGLDMARLSGADVVLANYEAVSDYQLSFGAVPFAAVVLDEAQKIKSPSARMTHAVKALHSQFMLAMTGTPVENRLADLWCIADAVQPGALADLKDFSSRYEVEGANVGALREIVWQEESASPSAPPRILLRRLKTDKLEGLPTKHEYPMKVEMPARQVEAYERALALKEIAGPQGTLGMIHALRRVSLHPALLDGAARDMELKVEESARFTAMMDVLDRVAPTQEKVLVFLESLDLQDADQLPLLLQRRYGLVKPPMVINGQVSTEVRQARVNAFQRDRGFDVMLLSPKAGGVGLTLTAANHVIHLSRWWNPAVEDQCSDRVYRIGQKKPVHIYYPLAVLPQAHERSFDMQLQMLMERKRDLARNLLAAPAFTRADYADLINATRATSAGTQ